MMYQTVLIENITTENVTEKINTKLPNKSSLFSFKIKVF